jgi:hypothetical protein
MTEYTCPFHDRGCFVHPASALTETSQGSGTAPGGCGLELLSFLRISCRYHMLELDALLFILAIHYLSLQYMRTGLVFQNC